MTKKTNPLDLALSLDRLLPTEIDGWTSDRPADLPADFDELEAAAFDQMLPDDEQLIGEALDLTGFDNDPDKVYSKEELREHYDDALDLILKAAAKVIAYIGACHGCTIARLEDLLDGGDDEPAR